MRRRTFLSGVALAGATLAAPPVTATAAVAEEPVPALTGRPPRSDDPLWRWTAVQLADAIRRGRITSRAATESCLERLRAVNPVINAVAEVLEAEALAAADAADAQRRKRGKLGALHGVPITTKINVDLAGHATTNGVPAFANQIAAEDSASVANLRAAGAVVIGRTNVPSFSFRYFTDNPLHGATLNPWDPRFTPGGSSGGAAAAAAVGIGPLAHGNDIAGSVRYPAFACGVAGIRPTLGRVPSFNPSAANNPRPLSSQLISTQGLLSRTVGDLRLSLPALARRDVRDSWWTPAPEFDPLKRRGTRVALLTDVEGIDPDPSVSQGLQVAADALRAAGYSVEEAGPPRLVEAAELWSKMVITESRFGLIPLIRQFGDPKVNRELDFWTELTPEIDLAEFSRVMGMRDQIRREWRLSFRNIRSSSRRSPGARNSLWTRTSKASRFSPRCSRRTVRCCLWRFSVCPDYRYPPVLWTVCPPLCRSSRMSSGRMSVSTPGRRSSAR